MADTAPAPAVGQIGWVDLTVEDATGIRDFYRQVTGWSATAFSMGDHDDYCMNPPGADKPVAGICHALGENAGLPPVWLIYITVADLEESVRQCTAHGGKVRTPVRTISGMGRFCVIEDPAGAVAALYQSQ
jgi:predicted enzyme related to lactoylglutathione lyase